MNTKRELVGKYGTQAALAESLGVTPGAVSQWDWDKPIPQRHWWRLPSMNNKDSKAPSSEAG